MVKYAESMLKLQELLQEEANLWRAGPLMVSIATSLTNDKQVELDFSMAIICTFDLHIFVNRSI
jgi:hypothetical protein